MPKNDNGSDILEPSVPKGEADLGLQGASTQGPRGQWAGKRGATPDPFQFAHLSSQGQQRQR